MSVVQMTINLLRMFCMSRAMSVSDDDSLEDDENPEDFDEDSWEDSGDEED